MADAVLTRDGPVSVPLDYVVPQGGELAPLTVRAVVDGTGAATSFYAVTEVISPSGRSMGKYITGAIAAGGSADVTWFPGAELEQAAPADAFVTETIFLPTWATSVSAGQALTSGQSYNIAVQGDYSIWTVALGTGSPQPDAMFPSSSGVARTSTQVGLDPDTCFAKPTGDIVSIGHNTAFEMNLGAGFTHVEPIGGPYSTPQNSFFYTYRVTGQGAVPAFRINDSNRTDNYGKLKIVIYGQTPGVQPAVVTDGTTSVSGLTELDFTSGATVTDGGNGTANVAITAAGGTVTNVSSADSSIVVTNPTTTPSLQLAALSTIATNEPPTANWSNNSKKITSLANGTAASDAAAFGQIPTSGTPAAGASSDVQVFAAGSSTWNKPTGTKVVEVVCIGSGGGGGGGFPGTGAANVSGGGGGGGGATTRAVLQASDVPSSVTVTVGTGGAGGASNTNGSDGALTTFGTLLAAGGGGGGAKGASAAGSNSGAGGGSITSAVLNSGGLPGPNTVVANTCGGQSGSAVNNADGHPAEWGGAGGAGGASGTNQHNGGGSIFGGPGGGSGGGAGTTTGTSGGVGGTTQSFVASGGGAAGTGGASTTAGGAGTFTGPFCGSAGGGGGSGNTGVTGGKGGKGSTGAGGGGGGASANGTGGAGGDGGDGRCIVISY